MPVSWPWTMTRSDTGSPATPTALAVPAALAVPVAFTVLVVALALVAGVSVGATGLSSVGGVASTATAQDVNRIDSCATINESGTYVLTADVERAGNTSISQACIRIIADDVTLDGNNHTLDGRGESHTKGVAVVGAKNVTVRNVTVGDWHSGVLVENGSATVGNVRATSNAYGVRLEHASGSTVRNNTIEDNLVGVYTDDEDVTIEDNDLSGNEIGVKRATKPGFRAPPANGRPSALRA